MVSELKDRMQKDLGIPDEYFGSYESDLHVLLTDEVRDWIAKNYEFPGNTVIHRADVEGHPWYGEYFIDIPFAVDNRKRG